jgi:hypothetical protein
MFDILGYVYERSATFCRAHGRAMRYAAERRNLAESIVELREMAGRRDDILAGAAGIEAGSWYAWPAHHVGYELVAAGMLIMAGGRDGKPFDFGELKRWTRVGFERGMRFRKGSGDRRVGLAPAQGKERPHAIAWGLCLVAASC